MHAAGADISITDEVPPYLWRGPQALRSWSADLEGDAKKRGIGGLDVARVMARIYGA